MYKDLAVRIVFAHLMLAAVNLAQPMQSLMNQPTSQESSAEEQTLMKSSKSNTSPELERLEKIKGYIRTLIAKGQYQRLARFIQALRAGMMRRRMERCLHALGSRAVCENNVAFYMWAQLLAKDIMNGQLDKTA